MGTLNKQNLNLIIRFGATFSSFWNGINHPIPPAGRELVQTRNAHFYSEIQSSTNHVISWNEEKHLVDSGKMTHRTPKCHFGICSSMEYLHFELMDDIWTMNGFYRNDIR